MFERFRQDARQAVILAQQEAHGLRHQRIVPAHLLLGLAAYGRGPAARVLREHGLGTATLRAALTRRTESDPLDPEALATLGIDIDQVRRVAEESFGEGALDDPHRVTDRGRRHIPFTAESRKALELSLRHAIRLKHRHIDSGHLLLGLLHVDDNTIGALLSEAGVAPDTLRTEVTRAITSDAA